MAIYNLNNNNKETDGKLHNGGELQVIISGNFAGAVVKMKVWTDEKDKIVLTDDDFRVFKNDIIRLMVGAGSHVSFFIENSTVNTDLRIYTN